MTNRSAGAGRPKRDCYDYVRRFYGVPAHVGVRVKIRDREGVLTRRACGDHYVYVRLDGDKRITGPFHPTDEIVYLEKVATP